MLHMIKPGEDAAESLDRDRIPFNEVRAAEIFASPAIAYKRIYLATEAGLFCLGDEDAAFEITGPTVVRIPEPAAPSTEPVRIQIIPAETWVWANEMVNFKVRVFDRFSRVSEGNGEVEYSLDGLQGEITDDGRFRPDKNAMIQAGYVVAKSGGLESRARMQVTPNLPIEIDFDNFPVDENPPYWPNASKFIVKELDGEKVLMKPPSGRGLNRHNLFLTPPEISGYTIQADMKATKVKRRSPDMGLISHRYYFDFMTKKNQLQIRMWPAELERLMVEKDYEWNPDLWYTMKMRVDIKDGKGTIKGKIWPRGEEEPEAWIITAEDPIPNTHGSPALYGDSATEIFYDNVKITKSE